jgi:hypothetical protein
MFALTTPIATVRVTRPRAAARTSVTTRAGSSTYDTLSGYQKNRMANAKTSEEWAAIEADVPGAKAIYDAAMSTKAEQSKIKSKKDPMDALCADDPSAVECKTFD